MSAAWTCSGWVPQRVRSGRRARGGFPVGVDRRQGVEGKWYRTLAAGAVYPHPCHVSGVAGIEAQPPGRGTRHGRLRVRSRWRDGAPAWHTPGDPRAERHPGYDESMVVAHREPGSWRPSPAVSRRRAGPWIAETRYAGDRRPAGAGAAHGGPHGPGASTGAGGIPGGPGPQRGGTRGTGGLGPRSGPKCGIRPGAQPGGGSEPPMQRLELQGIWRPSSATWRRAMPGRIW